MAWQNFQDEAMKRFDDLQTLINTVLINQQTILANQATGQAATQAILSKETEILTKEQLMSLETDAIAAAVTKVQGAADSTIALVSGLSDYIKAHANDPAALMAFANSLNDEGDKLAAAVEANPIPT